MTSKPAVTPPTPPTVLPRRRLLSGMAAFAAGGLIQNGKAETVKGEMPWSPGLAEEPAPIRRGGLVFFTADEAATVGAFFDRLIPADALSMSASEAGCVVFTDRELAGEFGKASAIYRLGRFIDGTPEQGPQFKATPAERYRTGLAALDKYCTANQQKRFIALTGEQQDGVISGLEMGKIKLDGVDGVAFFGLLLQNVREGFLSDPMYGGNKDMTGWKMVGFPGARYDFRDVVDQRGKKLNIIPISMADKGV